MGMILLAYLIFIVVITTVMYIISFGPITRNVKRLSPQSLAARHSKTMLSVLLISSLLFAPLFAILILSPFRLDRFNLSLLEGLLDDTA